MTVRFFVQRLVLEPAGLVVFGFARILFLLEYGRVNTGLSAVS